MPSNPSRLLVPPPVAVGLLLLVGVAGWAWMRASAPTTTPSTESAGVIPLGEATRTGTAVPLAAPAPELRDGCTYLVRLPHLAAVSDKGLADHAGLFDASPLLVFEDDRPLTPHARGGDCDGGFAHGPLGLFVRPADRDASAHTYTVQGTADLDAHPRRGPQGPSRVLYAYPGTTLTIPMPVAWRSDWGPPTVRLAAVTSQADAPAVLAWHGEQVPVPGINGPVRASLTPTATGAGDLTLTVPADGPLVVVHDLIVGTGPSATAVVGTEVGLRPPEASAADAPTGPQAAVSRVGKVPVTPLAALPSGDAGTCRYVLDRPDLEALSDLRLYERYGYVSASPVRVLQDGRPLAAHDRGEGCTGAIAHPPQGLVIRPDGPGSDRSTFALTYDPSPFQVVEVRGATKAALSWVYPGTTVQWDLPEPLRDGEHEVVLDVVAEGGTSPATVQQGPHTATLAPRAGEARVAVLGPHEGPWRISLTSPADGPIVLVRDLDSRPVLEPLAAPSPPSDDGWPMTLEGPGAWLPFLRDAADATVAVTTLPGDRPALTLSATTAAPGSRLCSAFRPATGDVTVQADVQVHALTPGDRAWMTASVEDAWQDAQGAHLEIDGKAPSTRFPLTEVGPLTTRTWVFPHPPGGAQVRLCVRFAQATGRITIGDVRVVE